MTYSEPQKAFWVSQSSSNCEAGGGGEEEEREEEEEGPNASDFSGTGPGLKRYKVWAGLWF